MSRATITVEYSLGGWNPRVWKGDLRSAKQIALGEIHEHCGGSSPAYAFTKAIFEYHASQRLKKPAKPK